MRKLSSGRKFVEILGKFLEGLGDLLEVPEEL
jgi:hypothetical protein